MGKLISMTGFGRSELRAADDRWVVWEIRSVNGRGLDLGWRLPAGLDGVEPALRDMAAARLTRGHVQCALSLRRSGVGELQVDQGTLDRMLAAAIELAGRIPGALPPRAEALLALPGVIVRNAGSDSEEASAGLVAEVREGFALALDRLEAAREVEGAKLGARLQEMLSELGIACEAARRIAAGQPEAHRARLTQALDALLGDRSGLPEARLAQEVALLATRTDVREELDRLASHLAGVASLLRDGGPVGRTLNFLAQELGREANTVCSKSASLELTQVGLRLKGVIEQLREQAQNLE